MTLSHPSQNHVERQTWLSQFLSRLSRWIRQEIVDDDPWDEEGFPPAQSSSVESSTSNFTTNSSTD